jgi:hypothetical protein
MESRTAGGNETAKRAVWSYVTSSTDQSEINAAEMKRNHDLQKKLDDYLQRQAQVAPPVATLQPDLMRELEFLRSQSQIAQQQQLAPPPRVSFAPAIPSQQVQLPAAQPVVTAAFLNRLAESKGASRAPMSAVAAVQPVRLPVQIPMAARPMVPQVQTVPVATTVPTVPPILAALASGESIPAGRQSVFTAAGMTLLDQLSSKNLRKPATEFIDFCCL